MSNSGKCYFCDLNISLTLCYYSKLLIRSRSFQGKLVSVWLSFGKCKVGLRLKGILVDNNVIFGDQTFKYNINIFVVKKLQNCYDTTRIHGHRLIWASRKLRERLADQISSFWTNKLKFILITLALVMDTVGTECSILYIHDSVRLISQLGHLINDESCWSYSLLVALIPRHFKLENVHDAQGVLFNCYTGIEHLKIRYLIDCTVVSKFTTLHTEASI